MNKIFIIIFVIFMETAVGYPGKLFFGFSIVINDDDDIEIDNTNFDEQTTNDTSLITNNVNILQNDENFHLPPSIIVAIPCTMGYSRVRGICRAHYLIDIDDNSSEEN